MRVTGLLLRTVWQTGETGAVPGDADCGRNNVVGAATYTRPDGGRPDWSRLDCGLNTGFTVCCGATGSPALLGAAKMALYALSCGCRGKRMEGQDTAVSQLWSRHTGST